MTRVLVTGATGLLGPYLADAWCRLGEVVTTSCRGGDRPCDLTDETAVARLVGDVDPDVIVHAAALTDVDACERNPEMADALNRGTVQHLAQNLSGSSSIVLVSTDQVYPDSAGPHVEDDIGPVNVYGATKRSGELVALSSDRSLVVRTNFFGASRSAGRRSLSDFVADSLARGDRITLFEDVLFSPLHVATVSEVTVELARLGVTGVVNVGSSDGGSKLEFGLAVAAHLALDTATVTAGRSSDVPGRAPRPKDLRMAVGQVEGALQSTMPRLRDEVAKL